MLCNSVGPPWGGRGGGAEGRALYVVSLRLYTTTARLPMGRFFTAGVCSRQRRIENGSAANRRRRALRAQGYPVAAEAGMIRLVHGTGRFELTLVVRSVGRDLCAGLYGGDTPHIGAAALAVPFPSPWRPGRIEASASLLVVTGHKEGELAQRVASELAVARDCVVSATCGIHLDGATKADIRRVLETADILLAQAVERCASRGDDVLP